MDAIQEIVPRRAPNLAAARRLRISTETWIVVDGSHERLVILTNVERFPEVMMVISHWSFVIRFANDE